MKRNCFRVWFDWLLQSYPYFENGSICRDGNTFPNQKLNSSKQQASELTAIANLPRFQSFSNKIENLFKICQTLCHMEQKAPQAFQTCQTCQTRRFRNLGSIKTPILSLPSLPFSKLVPIKHALEMTKTAVIIIISNNG